MHYISFFSYKGGAGRSSALVNTIPFLAKMINADTSHPIILLDMDMDSTGLTYLLHQSDKVGDYLTIQRIMVDGIPGGNNYSKSLQEHPFFSRLLKVGGEFGITDEGTVLLLPAEAGVSVGKDETNRNMTNRDTGHVERIADLCYRYGCSAIVFDSSSGDQETATVSNSRADVIVCCMRPTTQFQEGTLDYFRRMSRKIRGRDVILLPNAVSRNSVEVDGKYYPITAKNRIIDTFKNAFPDTGNTIHLDALSEGRFGIPLVSRFLWKEAILSTFAPDELSEDEMEAMKMYEFTASLIVKYGKRED